MTKPIEKNVDKFRINGNIAPVEVSDPDSLSVFDAEHCDISLEPEVSVDGHWLKAIKGVGE